LPFLSWIRFSLDAGTENTYSFVHKTRPGDFGKVIENIRYAAELKRKKGYGVTIGVQALLIRQNAEEMETFARLAKEMGVDNIQIKPYSHHPFSNNVDDELVPYAYQTNGLKVKLQAFSDEKFNVVYREKTMERLCEGRTYDQCFGLPFFALVDSRGNVIPCNLFYNMPDFYYGNIHEERFSEIWGGSKRKEVLKRLNETGVANCRNGCRLDASNRYLHRLRNPHPHDTFV
jgi:radical SAM protein with 4Fe4S-binding SPASM domain